MPTRVMVAMAPEEQPPPIDDPQPDLPTTPAEPEPDEPPPAVPPPPVAPPETTDALQATQRRMDRMEMLLTDIAMQLAQRPTPPSPSPVEFAEPQRLPVEEPPVVFVATHEQQHAANVLIDLLEPDDGRSFRIFCQDENVEPVEALRAALTCIAQQNGLRDKVRSFLRFQTQPGIHQEGCPVCHYAFHPLRRGQVYCCNACSGRAAGLRPVVLHAPGCPTGRGQEIPFVMGAPMAQSGETYVGMPQGPAPFQRAR